MKWKLILLLILVAIPLVPGAMYVNTLDWNRSHSAAVSKLPIWQPESRDGEYQVMVGDLTFRVRMAGMQNTGPAIIALHGFPESSIMWRALSEPAAAKGYRFIAFDQRGYSPGARPSGKGNYHMDLLAADALGIADALGVGRFHLVGHDWGAAVAWRLTATVPERLMSLSALSIPHFGDFMANVRTNPEQTERSSYFSFFRTPLLPELGFGIRGKNTLRKTMPERPAYEVDDYTAILTEPGALTAALNWYRAMEGDTFASDPAFEASVTIPTLFIWGSNDPVIARSTIASHRKKMPAAYTELELDAAHALIQEKPEEVVTAILKIVAENSPG